MCWFSVVQFGLVWFSGVRWPKRAIFFRDVHQHMLLLKQQHLLVRWGSVGFGGVQRGAAGTAAGKGVKKLCVVSFLLLFGLVRRVLAGFGGFWRGLAGLKT